MAWCQSTPRQDGDCVPTAPIWSHRQVVIADVRSVTGRLDRDWSHGMQSVGSRGDRDTSPEPDAEQHSQC